jgi:tRNA-2-methylthio-N6-dimethylallyladenosine synthase
VVKPVGVMLGLPTIGAPAPVAAAASGCGCD